ncbi:kinase-like domain-containing protein [Russula emetica]|nr:kinase-like domain-containing protein [Russula emetica]
MLEKEEEGDTKAKIQQLRNSTDQHDKRYHMKSFHTKDTGNKRKRPNSDVDGVGGGAGGGDATDCAELRAHGYQVEPRDIVDEDRHIMIESFSNTPPHILTVYEQSVRSKKFIAKKVCEQSNELEIFKLLNTFQRKSEHIISLHESFRTQSTSWAILPEMNPVAGYVSLSGQLHGKVAQVCWGLIKGVAYLHEFCIAHRDIKPENLVVDRDFCLKMIDFDVAMRVRDEHEVVDGQCGTEGWMAPEIEEKSMYSPIKADRWSTGQVLLYFLNKFRGEDTVLRTTARKLTAHNPERRSSMLQVAASLSDVVTNEAVERKASRSLQVTAEVDRENVKPQTVKKQKLSAHDRTVFRDIRHRPVV